MSKNLCKAHTEKEEWPSTIEEASKAFKELSQNLKYPWEPFKSNGGK